MFFTITLTCVAIMLVYAVPGYLLVRTKMVQPSAISAFATVLLYVCQPCLTVYSFQKCAYSPDLVRNLLIFFAVTLLIQGSFLAIFFLIFRSKFENIRYRICTLATTFGNCTFMGVPLLEALFPDKPEAVMYSLAYFLAMSILSWTAGSYIITQDKKYISIKKLVLNPSVISMIVAIPIFVTGYRFQSQVNDMFTLVGKMTTPICMMILGMRLATVKIKPIFTSVLQYFCIAIKQLLLPLTAFVVLSLLPIDSLMKQTLFILAATPVASVVLNFAEMLGKGQETAANVVLLGTLLSVLTIPVMSLLLG